MEHRIIQSIIEITRARDTETLESSLLATLADLLPVDHVAMIHLLDELKVEKSDISLSLDIVRTDQGETVHRWTDEVRHIELPADLLAKLAGEKTVVAQTQSLTSLFVPVFEESRLAKLIKLESADKSLTEQQQLVEGIADIYSNFLKVLDDSQRDKLTGLLNRRTFDKKLLRMMELQRSAVEEYGGEASDRRQPSPEEYAWLAIIDIDHFKKVNDQHGHIYGDEVILTVGQRMQKFFRNTDLLFRFGGEEFIVVLEPMAVETAVKTLDRFRDAVATQLFKQIGGISVSIGFARLEERDYPPEVIDRADKALYYCKEHGRNQVAGYEVLVDEGKLVPNFAAAGEIDLF